MTVTFSPLAPWTLATRAAVEEIAEDLADLDREEIFGARPRWHRPRDVVSDVAQIIAARLYLDGFVAWRETDAPVPFAVAMAYRATLPRVANVVLFGRKGHARAVPAVYAELASRMITFGARHRIALAQVPIFTEHRVARRRARALGAEEVFDYGPIGTGGQNYTHAIWRFPDGFSAP